MVLQKLSGSGDFGEYTQRSSSEAEIDASLRLKWESLLPGFGSRAWQWDQLLLLKRQVLSRLLHFDHLYRLMLPVQGCVLEMGNQWGAGLATLINLRAIYEPYNYARRVVGFDTFSGFSDLDAQDGAQHRKGDLGVPSGWFEQLTSVLELHEANAPLSHIKKFELIAGDASDTVPRWLEDNPGALVSMAIFDMDVYRPTRDALKAILPRMPKGALLVFDELNCPHFPGETVALLETLELRGLRLQANPHQPFCSWAVIE
jgi:hypothetical protein